ncbi:hypothetical protein PENNAL_c0125G08637 [Penicillium nalgiovense]|uniref:Uncharacterized protein n=1 Tax=Penicillium nalgiovense TaxID=60175 RepID=A0A1V6X4R4_PENNA|nr:hypothetical protein PENNAL_c0125G08637 [Penicillium nalgiovense]
MNGPPGVPSFHMAPETGSLGYVIIDCHVPPEELVNAAKAEVKGRLTDFQDAASDEHGYGILGWGSQCASLFRTHEEIFNHPFFASQVGDNPESNLYIRGVACFVKNTRPLPRVRVGYDRIYIYRPLEKTLGPEDGLFRLVPGSHREKAGSVERQAEVDIRLSPGQVLLMDGNMKFFWVIWASVLVIVNIQGAGRQLLQRSTVPIIFTSGEMRVFPSSLRWPLLLPTLDMNVLVVVHNDKIVWSLEWVKLAL